MTPEDFPAFFQAVNDGYEPFPWQKKLAAQVASTGQWPRLKLPTGTGKTAVIDIAVFTLALSAQILPAERTASRRIFFVIDRRIVVDEAYQRARLIVTKLAEALNGESGILQAVAQQLCLLSGTGIPLQAVELRGGIYRDESWADTPTQPIVCVSTVDQVGSRLLFRGYGCSPNAWPIHAALVATDSLIFLDEAHLSRPFQQTVEAIADRYVAWADERIHSRLRFVSMSATLEEAESPFTLDLNQNDPKSDIRHAVLQQRLKAKKRARLLPPVPTETVTKETPPAKKTEIDTANRAKFVSAVTAAAVELSLGSEADVVGIIVNRVNMARAVFGALKQRVPDADAILLTGRTRSYDRDALLAEYWERIKAGRKRDAKATRKLFVVATQCVEVGANIDFDALVTECAALDALRQRFGRLDRMGDLQDTDAVIMVRKDQVGTQASDFVYGDKLKMTWKWLEIVARSVGRGKERRKVVDFGILDLPLPTSVGSEDLCGPRANAPVLLPAHLDAWVQTSPRPTPEPDISHFLHGPNAEPSDVNIVWRADLSPDAVDLEAAWVDIVSLCPPLSGERMPVPFHVARAWLARLAPPDFADVEGEQLPDDEARRQRRTPRLVLRWGGPNESKIIGAEELRPGDTLVVPSTYGGADRFGWNPESTDAVTDIGDAVSWTQKRIPCLRLHPEVWKQWQRAHSVRTPLHVLPTEVLQDGEPTVNTESIDSILQTLATDSSLPEWRRESVRELLAVASRRLTLYPGSSAHFVLRGRLQPSAKRPQKRNSVGVTDLSHGDESTVFSRRVTLTDHSLGVKHRVQEFCAVLGIANSHAADLLVAAWLHDVGKADFRFQTWLHDGDAVEAASAPAMLAKSGMDPLDRAAIRRARERSGYPQGGRHELLSAALAASAGVIETERDRDLILHLLASHHGRCRPLAPVVGDTMTDVISFEFGEFRLSGPLAHGLERLDSGVADRFWNLTRRYGYWGLAYLEALLRLADQLQSSQEAEIP